MTSVYYVKKKKRAAQGLLYLLRSRSPSKLILLLQKIAHLDKNHFLNFRYFLQNAIFSSERRVQSRAANLHMRVHVSRSGGRWPTMCPDCLLARSACGQWPGPKWRSLAHTLRHSLGQPLQACSASPLFSPREVLARGQASLNI